MSALSPSQQPTVLFSIYQNNTWTIRPLVDKTINPANQLIILKIVGFIIFRQREALGDYVWGNFLPKLLLLVFSFCFLRKRLSSFDDHCRLQLPYVSASPKSAISTTTCKKYVYHSHEKNCFSREKKIWENERFLLDKIPVLGNFQYICQNSRCRNKTLIFTGNKGMPIIVEIFSSRIFTMRDLVINFHLYPSSYFAY